MIMSKRNIAVVVVLALAVVAVGLLIYRDYKDNRYSVIYMTTGEVYIGKLRTFPDFELTDAYLYQVTKDVADPTKSNFQIIPIKEALWAPKSMHLTKENVAFYGQLLPTSKIVETIAGKGK